jgi:hypothetical protein
MSLSDKIHNEKDFGESFQTIDIKDIREAVKELKEKICICKNGNNCFNNYIIKEIFGEKLI